MFLLVALAATGFACLPDKFLPQVHKLQHHAESLVAWETTARNLTNIQLGSAVFAAKEAIRAVRRSQPQPTGDAATALDEVEATLSAVADDGVYVLNALPPFEKYTRHLRNYNDKDDRGRFWSMVGVGCLLMLALLFTVVNVTTRSGGCRCFTGSTISLSVFLAWCVPAVLFALAVGLADVCHDPAGVSEAMVNHYLKDTQRSAAMDVLTCRAGQVTELQRRTQEAISTLETQEKELSALQAWAEGTAQEPNVLQLTAAREKGIWSLQQLLPMTACSPLHAVWRGTHEDLCGPVYSQVLLITVGFGAAAVALLFAFMCLPHRQTKPAAVDDPNVLLEHAFTLLPEEEPVSAGARPYPVYVSVDPSRQYTGNVQQPSLYGAPSLAPKQEGRMYPYLDDPSPRQYEGPVGAQIFNPATGQFEVRSTTPRNPFGYQRVYA